MTNTTALRQLKVIAKCEEIEKGKEQLKENISVELTNLLNQFVEETSFNEDDILEIIKDEANKMEYGDY